MFCDALHVWKREEASLCRHTISPIGSAFSLGVLDVWAVVSEFVVNVYAPCGTHSIARFVSLGIEAKERLLRFGGVLLCTVALLFSQPNSIFAELIFVIPYFVCECFFAARSKEGHAGWKSLSVLLLLTFIVVVIWFGLYSSLFQ